MRRTGPERAQLRFIDQTVPRASHSVRRFYVHEHASSETALRVARAINRLR